MIGGRGGKTHQNNDDVIYDSSLKDTPVFNRKSAKKAVFGAFLEFSLGSISYINKGNNLKSYLL